MNYHLQKESAIVGNIIGEILDELYKAETKHPDWPTDHVHQAAIVAEEAGELVRATLQFEYEAGKYDEIRKEAIQTAAVAIRLLKNLPETLY